MSEYKFSVDSVRVDSVETKNRSIKTKIPCEGTKELLERLASTESRSMHGQLPIVWNHAKDFSVYDLAGNKWIDFTSTIFVANIGHANEHLIERVKKTLDSEIVATYAYPNLSRVKYLEELVEFAGKDFEKAFLLSAGTEATEAATKLMKLHGRKIGKEKNLVLSINGNWHGRTMGAQLLSSNSSQKEWINNILDETVQIPFPYPWDISEEQGADFAHESLEKLRESGISLEKDICGIMLETFQGWAAAFYPKSFVKSLREFADKNNILLSFDEMQSGFGRTGKKFGYEHYEVKADLICCGKGMGGGFPISGVIGTAQIMDLPEVGNMSSTHSGNPVMCAAGSAVLEEINRMNLVEAAANKGQILHTKLEEIRFKFPDHIKSIQGKGLIGAIIFNKEKFPKIPEMVSEIAENCMRSGLLVVHTGRESIKIGPPLTISEDALIEGIQVLSEVIGNSIGIKSE